MLHANHAIGEMGKWSALHQCRLQWQQKEFTAVPLLFIRQKRREQNSQIIIRCPHADALHLGCLGIVVDRRLVRYGEEHIAQMRRAFLAEKCRTLRSFGELHRVGHGQQVLHLVQLLVDIDEPALLQADAVQKYVRIQAQPPFCSS